MTDRHGTDCGALWNVARRALATVAIAAAALLSTPGAALAHGIDGSGQSLLDFVWLGVTHMLLGWDHLLFVAGIVLLAGELKLAAKLISVFVIGHSATLIAATLTGLQTDPRAVDALIAVSVVFVGAVGLNGRPARWWWFALTILGFGLVHGVGLSTRLQALGLPEHGLLGKVIAFNIGIEIGQIIGVLLMFMAAGTVRNFTADKVNWEKTPRYVFISLVAIGLVAASALTAAMFRAQAEEGKLAAAVGDCQVEERDAPFSPGGGHPKKDFYERTEQAPVQDFGHVTGDGFVIVRYRPDMPTGQLDELRTFVTGRDGGKVVAGAAAEDQRPLVLVSTSEQVMECTDLDMTALKKFIKTWRENPRSRPAQN